jgi:AraC family transcriptional regulator
VHTQTHQTLATIEAELRVPATTVRLVHFNLPEPFDDILRDGEQDALRFDLCLTPRPPNARASYCDRWGPHRFEPIGEVFVVPPGETVRARSDCGRQVSIVCWLYSEALRGWLDGDLEWNHAGWKRAWTCETRAFEACCCARPRRRAIRASAVGC